MPSWEALIDGYIKVGRSKGLAEATIRNQAREFERFGNWLSRRRPRVPLDQVDGDQVIRFVEKRAAFRSRATVSGVVSILRGIGEYLVQQGVWIKNPLRWIRGPKLDRRSHLPKRINKEHLKALMGAAQARAEVHSRYQAICLLAILYGTGLRLGELSRLDLESWDRETAILKVDGRKTGRARSLAVGEGVWRCIEAYLPHRHNRLEKCGCFQERALLVNCQGQRLNAANIRTTIRRLATAAKVPFVTIHQFRHSCASDLLEAGVSLPEVQRMMGHASIQSTVIYVDIADPCRAAAMERHPLNQFLAGDGRREAA
jgi:site-specific recombinase XerD